MRLNRAGEIDYYEELGVDRGAAPEEIRDSFRALVRLLHPDHQRDENLKAIAERQLRKVNRIYAVLSDPERRRRYDATLENEYRPPTIVFGPASAVKARELISRFVWIGAAVLGVAVVIWVATDSPSAPVFSGPERVNASAGSAAPAATMTERADRVTDSPAVSAVQRASDSEEVSQLRAALRAARSERDEARLELMELKGREETAQTAAAAASTDTLTSASTSMADPAPPRLNPVTAAPPASGPSLRNQKAPGQDAHQFAGFWFFAKTSQEKRNRNLYYPEFIEAVLSEQNGVVRGRYRARYQITDRAISPDVNFEFSGSPGSGGALTCAWTGQGGARGQLTLHMTGENDMKVDWTASEIGTVQGLASGTATLTRRVE
jgi:hypothetical protein